MGWVGALVDALHAAGLPVAVAGPGRVRHFARALGVRGKTDRVDAAVLARYAERVRPAVRAAPSPGARALSALAARRRQLTAMLAAEKNRLQAVAAGLRAGVRAHIRWLEARLTRLDAPIGAAITADPPRAAAAARLQTVPGVGPVVAQSWRTRSPRSCRSSATSVGAKPPRSSASPRSRATRARSAAPARSGAAARSPARRSTSRRCPACGATRRSAPSTSASSRRASRGGPPSPPPRTSCSPSSTPWPATAAPGARQRPHPLDSRPQSLVRVRRRVGRPGHPPAAWTPPLPGAAPRVAQQARLLGLSWVARTGGHARAAPPRRPGSSPGEATVSPPGGDRPHAVRHSSLAVARPYGCPPGRSTRARSPRASRPPACQTRWSY
jgi:hypothetical protein